MRRKFLKRQPGRRARGHIGEQVKSRFSSKNSGIFMSKPTDHSAHAAHGSQPSEEIDAIDAIVPMMPIVLPLAGAVLMFLLAFIAVFMA
jgi:hypothetical protein